MPLVIYDIPGRFSRVCGEQVPDSHYANPIDSPPPSFWESKAVEAGSWILVALLLGWFHWNYFPFPQPIWWSK